MKANKAPRQSPPSFPAASRAGRKGSVLIVQYSGNFGGSTASGRLVAKSLLADGWDVHVAFSFLGPYVHRYEELGCRTHVVEHQGWLARGGAVHCGRRWLQQVRPVLRFVRLMRAVKPTVVYVNTLVSIAAAVAAKSLSIPCVWHFRELFDDVEGEMHWPRVGGKRLVRTIVTRCADQMVAISQAVASNVLGEGKHLRLRIVPNAVGEEYFAESPSQAECRDELRIPQGVPVIGVPGTLRPVKGHPFFLEAAARIAIKKPNCRFVITGDGASKYRDELQAAADVGILRGRVRFLGTVADMRKFYRASDIICVPSVSESFGRTVIEAFACGAPVVATAVGGMRETIRHETTGLLVDYGDVDGLAHSLLRLLDDNELRGQLARAAREEAQSRYSEAVHAAAIRRVVSDAALRVGNNGPLKPTAGAL